MLITIYRWLKLDHDAFRYDHDLAKSLGLLEDGPGEAEPPSVRSVTSRALRSRKDWNDYHRLVAAHPLMADLKVTAQGSPDRPGVRVESSVSPLFGGAEGQALAVDRFGYAQLDEEGLLSDYRVVIARWPQFDTGRRQQGLYHMPDQDPQNVFGRLLWERKQDGVTHVLRIQSSEATGEQASVLLFAILEGRIAPVSNWSSAQVKASLLDQATT